MKRQEKILKYLEKSNVVQASLGDIEVNGKKLGRQKVSYHLRKDKDISIELFLTFLEKLGVTEEELDKELGLVVSEADNVCSMGELSPQIIKLQNEVDTLKERNKEVDTLNKELLKRLEIVDQKFEQMAEIILEQNKALVRLGVEIPIMEKNARSMKKGTS